MTGAKLQSKIANSAERVKSMQHMYSLERISKQKNLMKFIREQLRLSDFRRVIDKISKVGRDSLDEIDMQRRELLAASQPSVNQSLPDNNRIRALMMQLMQVAEQLSATSLYNGQDDSATNNDDVPVGSLELRIPDSQVDDETLHGVVGLLVGALGPTNGQYDEEQVRPREGAGRGDAFKQSDMAMGDGLGLDLSGARLSAATQIAKTFMTVQSNYSDRILLLNLKDNLLSDISCKILSGLVEKTKSLRMLDLRGNMISPVGAKMLFDATRRNQSILYVTQRQNGFMVEGHREIMGSVQQRDKGGVSHQNNAYDEHKHREDEEEDEAAVAPHVSAKQTVRNMTKKQPLRIDMRNNNPEQEAIEKLMESNEYTSRTGMREKYHNNLANDEPKRDRAVQRSSAEHDSVRQKNHSHSHSSAQKHRPHSSAGHGTGSGSASNRIAGAGLSRTYDGSNQESSGGHGMMNASSENSRLQRPVTSSGLRTVSASQSSKSRGGGGGEGRPLLPQVGDSDDSDEEIFNNQDERIPPDPTNMTEIQKRLAAKENERIIGIRTRDGGSGVGSLLDKEIRQMQEQTAEGKATLRKSTSAVSTKTTSKRGAGSARGGSGGSSGGWSRPKSANSATRNSRNRPSSASGSRRSQSSFKRGGGGGATVTGGTVLNKSSSEGVLRKKGGGGSRTPQRGMSAAPDVLSSSSASKSNSGNNAHFHLNPAVLF